ncbi:hypothetical protein ACA910_015510 [Epithemia clementina (nom. ined.)]
MDLDSMLSVSLDLHLEKLATCKRENKCTHSAGRCSFQMESSLVQGALPRLRADWDLPVLIAIKRFCTQPPCKPVLYKTLLIVIMHVRQQGQNDNKNGILEDALCTIGFTN